MNHQGIDNLSLVLGGNNIIPHAFLWVLYVLFHGILKILVFRKIPVGNHNFMKLS